jgi:hypothetical protein
LISNVQVTELLPDLLLGVFSVVLRFKPFGIERMELYGVKKPTLMKSYEQESSTTEPNVFLRMLWFSKIGKVSCTAVFLLRFAKTLQKVRLLLVLLSWDEMRFGTVL